MRFAPLVAALVVALAACGSSTPEAFTPPPNESYPAAVLSAGEVVYAQRCATCHGNDGAGRAGPSLINVWERLSVDEHRNVVINGRRTMPSFELSLTPEELDAVVAYTRAGWALP